MEEYLFHNGIGGKRCGLQKDIKTREDIYRKCEKAIERANQEWHKSVKKANVKKEKAIAHAESVMQKEIRAFEKMEARVRPSA